MSKSLRMIIIAFIAAIVLTGFIGEKEVLFGPERTYDSYAQPEAIEEPITTSPQDILDELAPEENAKTHPRHRAEYCYGD